MASFRRRDIWSLVTVYCFVTVIVLGTWMFREAPTSAPGRLSTANFGMASTDAVEFATQDDSLHSATRLDFKSTAKRSIKSLEPEELDKAENTTRASVSPISEAELQGSLPLLYHSPKVFTLIYEEMTRRIRIFVYPSQKDIEKYEHRFDEKNQVPEEISSTADFFFRSLGTTKFVTQDPESAQLFLLPASVDSMWVDLGPARVAEQLRQYVQKVRDNYPFWERSLGADHVFLSCHSYPQIRHRNYLELSKNAIQIACSPLRRNQYFFPHKDIVVPNRHKSAPVDETRAALGKMMQRTALAYFSGPALEVDSESASVLEDWKSDPDFVLDTDPTPSSSSTYKKMAQSKFCVTISPHDTLNVVDSLRLGCLPVLISNSVVHALPFQDILNWYEFSVVVDIEDIINLKTLLSEISSTKYRQMQYLGHQASKHMQWNTPPVPYDAFHMTLFELWLRRHSIKYANRNDTGDEGESTLTQQE